VIGLHGLKSIKIDPFISLVVVLGILIVATVLSVIFPEKKAQPEH
jgi:preprotein translocase subunit Sec61beta